MRVKEGMIGMRKHVSIVDDDESVRESLPDLLRSLGFEAEPFSSAEEFLKSDSLKHTGCLLLDVAMPGMSGPELQLKLAKLGNKVPIIFITANTDGSLHRRLLQGGAIACLVKPFGENDLVNAVKAAFSGR
jgi:FixJ family two-component response regulator